MKRKVQKGFTIIELMIGIITGTIVILAAGMILFYGQKSWNNIWKRANLQRDASYAMQRMSLPIKAGMNAELEGGGSAIKIYRATDWIRFFLEQENNNLKCEIEGGGPQTIINGKMEALQFNVTGNTVTIDLKLREDNLQTHFASTVMMRNYGG